MKIFSKLYDRVLSWSVHPHATRYLGVVSFTESSFFPIPPDVLLAPMTLAQPKRWVYLAALTTVTSVLGGLFGYVIGQVAIDAVMPWLQKVGYVGHFETAQRWFADYGFWAIFAAGFTPIPYKVFTVAARCSLDGARTVHTGLHYRTRRAIFSGRCASALRRGADRGPDSPLYRCNRLDGTRRTRRAADPLAALSKFLAEDLHGVPHVDET